MSCGSATSRTCRVWLNAVRRPPRIIPMPSPCRSASCTILATITWPHARARRRASRLLTPNSGTISRVSVAKAAASPARSRPYAALSSSSSMRGTVVNSTNAPILPMSLTSWISYAHSFSHSPKHICGRWRRGCGWRLFSRSNEGVYGRKQGPSEGWRSCCDVRRTYCDALQLTQITLAQDRQDSPLVRRPSKLSESLDHTGYGAPGWRDC